MILFGIDRLLEGGRVAPDLFDPSLRVGLVSSDASRTALDSHLPTRVALGKAGCPLKRLFAPEHGLHATAGDGEGISDSIDPITGLPVFSLYGKRVRPGPEVLEDLDFLLFDLPDIGTRFYTFIWTLSHVMEACAEAKLPLMVLDRPNPIGGDLTAAEGPILDVSECGSFLGRHPIPIRHSLTVGELAHMWAGELNLELQVVEMSGWRRDMHWPDTGLPFIPPSPAIPDYLSALLYPAICLFEGINVSVGRGTDRPFQQIGAPWLGGEKLTKAIDPYLHPGIWLTPVYFEPEEEPYRGESCDGIRIDVDHPGDVRPVTLGLSLLATIRRLWRKRFEWAPYPTSVNQDGSGHFERLVGRREVREMLDENLKQVNQDQILRWTRAPQWAERVRPYLLYPTV